MNFHAASACLTWLITKYGQDEDDDLNLEDWESEPTEIFHLMHPFHVYIRHHWAKHIQAAQDDDEATLFIPLEELSSDPPKTAANGTQKWYEVIQQELDRITVMSVDAEDFNLYFAAGGYDEEAKDTRDFNQASHPEWSEFESEFRPGRQGHFRDVSSLIQRHSVRLVAGCEFDVSQVNGRGHDLSHACCAGGLHTHFARF